MRICTLCLQNYSKYIITFEDNSEKYFLGIVAKKNSVPFFCVRGVQKKRIYVLASSFHLIHETLGKSSENLNIS